MGTSEITTVLEESIGQPTMHRADLQGFFLTENTGAEVRLSVFPPVIPKGTKLYWAGG